MWTFPKEAQIQTVLSKLRLQTAAQDSMFQVRLLQEEHVLILCKLSDDFKVDQTLSTKIW